MIHIWRWPPSLRCHTDSCSLNYSYFFLGITAPNRPIQVQTCQVFCREKKKTTTLCNYHINLPSAVFFSTIPVLKNCVVYQRQSEFTPIRHKLAATMKQWAPAYVIDICLLLLCVVKCFCSFLKTAVFYLLLTNPCLLSILLTFFHFTSYTFCTVGKIISHNATITFHIFNASNHSYHSLSKLSCHPPSSMQQNKMTKATLYCGNHWTLWRNTIRNTRS